MKLLLIEDNDGLREQMKWALNNTFDIVEASSAAEAVEQFEKHSPRLISLDMGLDNQPDKGLEVIDELLGRDRQVKIVVITAHTSPTLGAEAITKGAFDYLNKPVDIDELKVILGRASRLLELEEPEREDTGEGIASAPDFAMIGKSKQMQEIFNLIYKLAQTEVNVLITGDSGTGKELCARAIHFHSERTDAAFVPINCSAIPETLLESELFGYVKGAFTGANTDKTGLIESANNGTLFLDEIGDMPRHLQVKLLRFLEDQTYQRVGEASIRKGNVRIIAATNKKALDGENEESMRSDLYYRLSEFEIHLPSLQDRGDDILLLAQHIIERNRTKFNMPKLKISPRSEQLLLQYNWPGNVRELENKLSRAAITCKSQIIEPEDLQFSASSFSNLTFKEAKGMFEKNFIINALRQADYNVSLAAKNVDISRPTLYDLMKKHSVTIKTHSKIKEL
jgi:two-component system NtrC family response regulator